MEDIRRILVVAPAQLGDMLICTPLIRAARLRWPEAQIDVLGFAGTLELLSGNRDISQRIEIPRAHGLKAQLRQAAQLWRRYDLAFVTRTTDRAHLYGVLAARCRSAMVPAAGQPGSRWKRWAAQHHFVPDKRVHQVMEKLQLIGPWMDMPSEVSIEPPAPQALPAQLEGVLRHPLAVVQVPSVWRYKQWPTAHYRAVVEGLLADGAQVVLTGSGSAHDRGLVAQVAGAGASPDLLDVSGQLTLRQVRTLLEQADAYLGPDTSVTHLAAAVGVPVVSVFGPSLPDSFGPWPQPHAATPPWSRRATQQQVQNIVLLQGPDLPGRQCVPCGRMGCTNRHDSDSHCLVALAPERVLAEMRSILRRR
jgi:heptosyltransferase III